MIRRLPSPALPLLTALLTACSGGAEAPEGGDETAIDTSADTGPETPDSGADDGDPLVLFPTDHLLEVTVTLAPADWAATQAEAATWFDRYNGADCLDAPYSAPSTERSARVTVDGADVGTVGLRRNGDWRSESAARPSLKVDLDPDGDGRRFHGVATMALENLAQDPGAVRLCAVYDALAALGEPAPRCALAHVTVNGEDLGVYAHVEDADDALFPRLWGDDVQVYEGGDADFLAGWTGSFDPKNDITDPKAPAVHALTDALATDPLLDDGATLLDAVAAVADLDALGRAWATEVLFEETAGYAAARGPMYAVVPADGLLRVVPWSPVVSLGASPSASPLDLLAAQVPARLAVADPARLPAALTGVLAAWDDAAMAADVTRLADLARPAMTGDVDSFEASVASATAFVEGRRAVLEAALAEGLPTPSAEPPLSPCLVEDGGITITFATTWGSEHESALTYGASAAVTAAGQDLGGAVAGPAADGVGAVYVASWRQGADVGEAGFRLAAIPTSPGTFDLDGRTNLGYERVRSVDGDRYWLLHGAVLTLSAQGTTDGDDVAGSFAGVRYRADAWGL